MLPCLSERKKVGKEGEKDNLPVFKRGNEGNMPENRTVTQTSRVCKLLDKIRNYRRVVCPEGRGFALWIFWPSVISKYWKKKNRAS